MVAHFVLLGLLTVTSYQPVPEQTKPECRGRFHCTTSIDDGITKFGVAVSQDLLQNGSVHYGDILFVTGYGYRVVNDTMAIKNHKAVDLMVFTKEEEKAIGVRHIDIYVLH